MKKITRFFIVIALAGLFSACSNTDVLEPESENRMEVSVHAEGLRSVEQALDDLHFMLRHMGEEQKIHRRIKKLRVLNKSDIRPITRAEKDTPLAYVVNFENEDGYAILGADKKIAPVIMIGDEGSFSMDEYEKYLSLQPEARQDNIQNYQFELITDALNSRMERYNDATRTIDTIILEYSKPLLKSKWGQSWPYNYYNEKPYENSPVGCAPVALAQFLTAVAIERNLIHPKIAECTIDWDAVIQATEASPKLDKITVTEKSRAVAYLIYACRKCLKTELGSQSSPTSMSNILNAFLSLGYTGAGRDAYSNREDFARSSIFAGRVPVFTTAVNGNNPALISKGGHVFVTDGWLRVRITDGNETLEPCYLHCNFGFEGKYDGYYYVYNVLNANTKFPNMPENGDSDLVTSDRCGVELVYYEKIGGVLPFIPRPIL